MNSKRYVIFGSVSLALHSLMLLAQPAQKEMIISMDSTTANLHLQFVSTPKKATSPLQEEQKTQEKPLITKKQDDVVNEVPEPKKAMAVKKPIQKQLATTTKVTKKVDKKNKPVVTAEKKQPIKEAKETLTPIDKPIDKPTESVASASTSSTPVLIKKPTFKARPTPVSYPRLAKRRGQQGKVLIEVWIDDKGEQIKHFIVDSSGFSTLDSAALSAISNWKFDVSTEHGYAIAHRVQIPVNFTLDR
ncbi:energy transducer TonB [Vibrio algarum]|uniref:Energy transducer TonB n=1 Tax=Vibrio algarum TaxID=3020714 RepID=A0ABT4YSG0_9VIBR|nr:energy transducer TonB [Vibrio sp. KJ40-1]MDB1124420.1 energy transducer TonB [Vibrio sp. KJ40-1]